MRILAALLLLAATCVANTALAAPLTFPPLTGRVVDDAHLLTPATQQMIEQQLANYETQSTNQVVVVTLPGLQNHTIEDYGYQLGRAWGIGQKGKNNGVLLIVAPQTRKVRIEVGYGLEGTLTDALTSQIIQGIILPYFKQGQMEQGIVAGTRAIVTDLGGQWSSAVPRAQPAASGQSNIDDLSNYIFFFIVIMVIIAHIRHRRGGGFFFLPFNTGGRGGNSDEGGGGSFGGGGGSFGGGGSSGSW